MNILCSSEFQPMLTLSVFDRNDAPFECRVRITEEEEGGFSIESITLPGVVTEGESIDEAIEHFREAFLGALETYAELGKEVPWIRPDEFVDATNEANVKERWILINVE